MTMSERDCVGRCNEKGGRYVFVSDGVVYRIRNQSFSDLARFAAQDIQLEGRLWRDQLTVSHIESIDHVADARSGLARRRQNLSVAKELISRRAIPGATYPPTTNKGLRSGVFITRAVV